MAYRMDLTGRRFGHLVVLRLDPEPYVSPSGKHKARRWICRCDCGREVSVVQSSLLSKEHPTKSCGCANHDEVSLSEKNNTAPTCPAWHCPMCRKVIIEYGKGQ